MFASCVTVAQGLQTQLPVRAVQATQMNGEAWCEATGSGGACGQLGGQLCLQSSCCSAQQPVTLWGCRPSAGTPPSFSEKA